MTTITISENIILPQTHFESVESLMQTLFRVRGIQDIDLRQEKGDHLPDKIQSKIKTMQQQTTQNFIEV